MREGAELGSTFAGPMRFSSSGANQVSRARARELPLHPSVHAARDSDAGGRGRGVWHRRCRSGRHRCASSASAQRVRAVRLSGRAARLTKRMCPQTNELGAPQLTFPVEIAVKGFVFPAPASEPCSLNLARDYSNSSCPLCKHEWSGFPAARSFFANLVMDLGMQRCRAASMPAPQR